LGDGGHLKSLGRREGIGNIKRRKKTRPPETLTLVPTGEKRGERRRLPRPTNAKSDRELVAPWGVNRISLPDTNQART